MMQRIFLSILVVAVLSSVAFAGKKKLVVVVAKGSAVTSISKRDLKACFLGEHVALGGKTLVPFNAEPKTPDRVAFDKTILGMDADAVGRYWTDRKVRGQSGAPRSLPSTRHVVKVVAKFPGAIGYVAEDEVTPELQVVKLDGVGASDPGYPLFKDG